MYVNNDNSREIIVNGRFGVCTFIHVGLPFLDLLLQIPAVLLLPKFGLQGREKSVTLNTKVVNIQHASNSADYTHTQTAVCVCECVSWFHVITVTMKPWQKCIWFTHIGRRNTLPADLHYQDNIHTDTIVSFPLTYVLHNLKLNSIFLLNPSNARLWNRLNRLCEVVVT